MSERVEVLDILQGLLQGFFLISTFFSITINYFGISYIRYSLTYLQFISSCMLGSNFDSKGKGKGKSKEKTKEIRDYRSKPIRKQPKNSKQKKKMVKRIDRNKTILLNHFDADLELNLTSFPAVFVKSLAHRGQSYYPILRQYSYLQNFASVKKGDKQRKIVFHTPKMRQVIAIVERMIAKRRGKTNMLHQIKELTKIVKSYSPPLAIPPTDSQKKWKKVQKRMLSALTLHLEQAKSKLNEQWILSQNQLIVDSMSVNIHRLTLAFHKETIVAILEKNNEDCEIIFEQSYNGRTYKIDHLRELLGERVYQQKRMAFVINFWKPRSLGLGNTNFIVCHRCKQVLTGRYSRCMNYPQIQVVLAIKNSPEIYCQRILDCDYGLNTEQKAQSLEYFKYSKDKTRFLCQRFICENCEADIGLVTDKKTYHCPFCKDICNCKSCCYGEEIVKQLALLKHFLMRYDQPLKIYEELLNNVNLQDGGNAVMDSHLRFSFEATEQSGYQAAFDRHIVDLDIMANNMLQFQQTLLRNPQLLKSKSTLITPLIEEAMLCYQFLRDHTVHYGYERPLGRQIITIKTAIETFNRQEDQHKKDLLQSMNMKKQGRPSKSTKIQKLMSDIEKHNKNYYSSNHYYVPFDRNLDLPQQMISESRYNQICNHLETVLTPVTSLPDNIIIIREDIPYDEQDYEKYLNLPTQTKIQHFYSNFEQYNLQNRIFIEMHDPFEGAMGIDSYQRYMNSYQEYQYDSQDERVKEEEDEEEDSSEFVSKVIDQEKKSSEESDEQSSEEEQEKEKIEVQEISTPKEENKVETVDFEKYIAADSSLGDQNSSSIRKIMNLQLPGSTPHQSDYQYEDLANDFFSEIKQNKEQSSKQAQKEPLTAPIARMFTKQLFKRVTNVGKDNESLESDSDSSQSQSSDSSLDRSKSQRRK